ncbi:hypothetical protein F4814DRAFT_429040 [Daldinia grandis]|nr:hypothetical protein F4814DRAFT_429040 [Daldinia grandis]
MSGLSEFESKSSSSFILIYLRLILYVVGIAFNTYMHLIQRSLRPAGTTKRQVPLGPGFSWVTCPNYMFESQMNTGILVFWCV